MPTISAAKSRRAAQLTELESRRDRISQEMSEPLSHGSDEAAIEVEADDSLDAERALVAREIASVKRALGRIEGGIYGECVRCGDRISAARLEARPEAALCIDCARHAG